MERNNGLTTHEAQKRLTLYGRNTLPHKKPVSDLILLFSQIKSPLIYILFIAAFISLLLGDYKDTLIIIVAVLTNIILGFYQERKAQKALYALKQILSPTAKVIRDGKVVMIPAEELVPEDVIILSTGDRVPADGEVIEEKNLLINEAVLTGESVPVAKESSNLVFMGCTVMAGRGKVLVTKTGLTTEFGKIASELQLTPEEQTPLQKRITILARYLAIIFSLVSAVVFISGLIGGKTFIEMFTTSVAVAVAAIPEGLTVSLTAILAVGMQRIMKRKGLVRKLVAAEALGSTTVIVTDKTGTLTQGIMSVVKTEFADSKEALLACVLANNREDPLEIAIWEHVQKKNLDPQKISESFLRIEELPFDAVRRYMTVVVQEKDRKTMFIKGAPETLIKYSSLSSAEKEKWLSLSRRWGEEGLRLIGIGRKYLSSSSSSHLEKDVQQITFLGLIGITDPVRDTVKSTLVKMNEAGIAFKVVTGDYAVTSQAVLKKLGINITGEQILEGEEIEKLSLDELEKRVGKTILFARVTPQQKLAIVIALQRQGEVVALLGDGVNDALAIKAADIGIVVSGATDVARLTADMVLLDSNFETIIAAVEEGRGIYQNIKKVILYLMAGSFSEVILVIGAILFGLPLPLTASQILWVNMLTDNLPSIALTIDPKEKNLLHEPPSHPKTNLLDNFMKLLIIVISGVTGLSLLIIFALIINQTNDLYLARTIVFMGLGITTLSYVFSVRILKRPIWKSHPSANIWLLVTASLALLIQLIPLYNPLLAKFLELTALSVYHWMLVLVVPLIVISVIELIKIFIIIPSHRVKY